MADLEQLSRRSPGDWFYDVRDQLKQHIYNRSRAAFDAGDAERDALDSADAVEARSRAIREALVAGFGGLPETGGRLNARTVGELDEGWLKIEKVIFESRPGHHVTANLYLPEDRPHPAPAIQFLCGHCSRAKHEPEYQRVCRYLACAGFIVLAQDPIGQGERFSYYDAQLRREVVSSCCPDHDHAGAQLIPLGQGLARYFLHDSMRGIDYLLSRPEVDGARIGVTGNSGGGTQTSLMMMGDPRIAAAAPGTFLNSRRSYQLVGGAQDAEQIWQGFTARGFDHEDVILAMAPKPVCVLAVTQDFFPIEGTRSSVERCRRIWKLFDRESCVQLVEDTCGHCYSPVLAQAAADFFSRHLLHRSAEPAPPAKTATLPPEQLWCTETGQVQAAFPGCRFVWEETSDVLATALRQRAGDDEARGIATSWLRQRVERFRSLAPLNPRFYDHVESQQLAAQYAMWWSQPELCGHGCMLKSETAASHTDEIVLALWDGGVKGISSHGDWIRSRCEAGDGVFVLDTSGVGGLEPRPINAAPIHGFYGTIHKLADDLLWLDDDLVSLRVWDVLRALDLLEQWPGLTNPRISVYAHGGHGSYGRLAALLDQRITAVTVAGPRASWSEWVGSRFYDEFDIYSLILPGALQHFDLPDVDAWNRLQRD
ncbi:MAG: acetylxylan esterase [Armatimonadetes bacterium]|nr:acetylxylan esterase [Armatimonadota bacterium]MDE2206006.1 acetylxylan esterase [Armatimonadota bacterium]